KPGVRAIIARIRAQGPILSPAQLVDACLDLIGPLTVAESTRRELMAYATVEGDLDFGADDTAAAARVRDLLQLIVSMREYERACPPSGATASAQGRQALPPGRKLCVPKTCPATAIPLASMPNWAEALTTRSTLLWGVTGYSMC